jgi:AbrB family looped-hinge helix DNA binding protein
MDAKVAIDKKGRLVLPKKVREEARICLNARLVVRAIDEGRIELFDPELLLKKAQEIGARKLAGWREEEHEAARLIAALMEKHRNEAS